MDGIVFIVSSCLFGCFSVGVVPSRAEPFASIPETNTNNFFLFFVTLPPQDFFSQRIRFFKYISERIYPLPSNEYTQRIQCIYIKNINLKKRALHFLYLSTSLLLFFFFFLFVFLFFLFSFPQQQTQKKKKFFF